MDIFDIFWTFYLNHLSPLQGYFFTDLGPPAPGEGTGGWGYLGVLGVSPRFMNACMHAQACTYMLKYIFKEIAKGCQYIYHDYCVCAHVQLHACIYSWAHVWGLPPPTYTPTHPPPRGTPIISKNLIHLEHIEIFQFCLKI